MPVAQPTGFGPEVLQPFNIPTSAPSPMQKAPNVGLSFPVFTPPAASSYGTTNPMTVPWTPPDLAGALNKGIETGAHLATDAIANKKSLSQIAAEEQAQKIAFARANAPGAGYYTTAGFGPGGAEVKVLSPAEVELQRAGLAKTAAETEASRAATAQTYGQTAEAQAKIAQQQAEAEKIRVQTGLLGKNVFERRAAAIDSGLITNQTSSDTTNPKRSYTGTEIPYQ
jgi:hypothetical protein